MGSNGNNLQNKTVVLFYNIPGIDTWIPISSTQTDMEGNYNIQWINSASGTFTLKTEWSGDAANSYAVNTTTLSFLPSQRSTFIIESNSTVNGLTFDNATNTLSFNVTGASATKGYVKATIAKSILPNGDQLSANIDGNPLNYTLTSGGDCWVYYFQYSHSSHQISLKLLDGASSIPDFGSCLLLIVIVVLLCTFLALLIFLSRSKNPVKLTFTVIGSAWEKGS